MEVWSLVEMKMKCAFALVCLGILMLSPAAGVAADKIDFVQEIKPILESACVSCHGPEKPKSELRLDTRAGAVKGGDGGPSLVPGKPQDSSLYKTTILPPDHDDIMPPKGDPLAKHQTEMLRRWIEEGAVWPENVTLQQTKRIDFAKDIQPILEFNCVACHREGHAKGDLRLDVREEAFKGGTNPKAIVPGRSKESSVYTTTVLPADHDDLMPPSNKGGPLPKEQTDLIALWIDQGANWPNRIKVLTPRKLEEKPKDEIAAVADIHKKIMANASMKAESEMKAYTNFIPGTTISYAMLAIPSGEFLMGSPENEKGRKPDEGPQHRVKIEPFWMGKYEVTWNEYDLFMYPDFEKQNIVNTNNPYLDGVSDAVSRPTKPYVEMSFGMGKDGYPCISMTQHAANKYCQWLSAKTGHFYRLPTEAEWEYAARAGTTTAYFWGDDPSPLGQYAWFADNSDFKYQKVGRKRPNPWGLHDIYGNVLEWCLDQYDPSYYKQLDGSVSQSPWNPSTKPYPHSARGGHWDEERKEMLRSAARRSSDRSWKQQDPQLPKSIWYHTDAQFLGFRLVRPLKVPSAEEMLKFWNNGVEKD